MIGTDVDGPRATEAGKAAALSTQENRARHDRSTRRHPGDPTDEEGSLVAPLIPPAKRGGHKRTLGRRRVVNEVLYSLSTGCQRAARPGTCQCGAW